jgi:virginiamycin B lyase
VHARPHAITAAADGALWFTQWGSNRIGRITMTGEVSEYDVPTPGSEPHGIVAGPDGALWFAEEAGKIGRLVPA